MDRDIGPRQKCGRREAESITPESLSDFAIQVTGSLSKSVQHSRRQEGKPNPPPTQGDAGLRTQRNATLWRRIYFLSNSSVEQISMTFRTAKNGGGQIAPHSHVTSIE